MDQISRKSTPPAGSHVQVSPPSSLLYMSVTLQAYRCWGLNGSWMTLRMFASSRPPPTTSARPPPVRQAITPVPVKS